VAPRRIACMRSSQEVDSVKMITGMWRRIESVLIRVSRL
jgi:hypothetical protein